MGWSEWPTWVKGGVIGLIVGVISLAFFPSGNCVEGINIVTKANFGYCINSLGFPLTFLVSGEISSIPLSHITKIFSMMLYLNVGNYLFSAVNLSIDVILFFLFGAILSLFVKKLKTKKENKKRK